MHTLGHSLVGRKLGDSLVGRKPGHSLIGRKPGHSLIGRKPGHSLIGRKPGHSLIGRKPGHSLIGRKPGHSLIGRKLGHLLVSRRAGHSWVGASSVCGKAATSRSMVARVLSVRGCPWAGGKAWPCASPPARGLIWTLRLPATALLPAQYRCDNSGPSAAHGGTRGRMGAPMLLRCY
jgi:hypothetical protein